MAFAPMSFETETKCSRASRPRWQPEVLYVQSDSRGASWSRLLSPTPVREGGPVAPLEWPLAHKTSHLLVLRVEDEANVQHA